MGDATKTYSSQLTSAGQAEIERGMLTLSRMYPVRDGIVSLTDTSAAGQAAGLRYSISPTLLDIKAQLGSDLLFCGNSLNFTTLRGLLAQFLQAFNSANPSTPADRVLGVGDQAVVKGSEAGCDDGRAAVNGNEAWARLIYDQSGAPSRTGSLMGMEIAHTMGAVPVGRNDGGFHSLYTNADYLTGDLNRAYNVATRSVLAGTNDDHTVMRFVTPWNNTNTVLEKADWGLLLCRFGGPTTSDCATAGTVGSAAAGPAFVMSGTTSGTAGICAACVGAAAGTNVVESYFSNAMPQTAADPNSGYRFIQRRSGAVISNQGVPVTASDTHHSGANDAEAAAGLFSIALPFDTSADRIELWKGTPGASGSLLLYARNTSQAPTVTSMSSGGPPVELRVAQSKRPSATTKKPQAARHVASAQRALEVVYTVNSAADPGDGVCDAVSCTLRDAIDAANASPGTDRINFNIGLGGLRTIHVASGGLPAITESVIIDGTTQPAYSGVPLIELDGTDAGTFIDGLTITGGGTTVEGLVINRFGHDGIQLRTNGGNTITANYIGTNAAGTAALGNGTDTAGGNKAGIFINNVSGNTIGGVGGATTRNVISGNHDYNVLVFGANSFGNLIQGNYIGPDASGSTALSPFPINGVLLIGSAHDNRIGSTNINPGGNVISGNFVGVELNDAPNNSVQGNLIGTAADGTTNLGNGAVGINVLADGSKIGGTASDERANTIAYNGTGVRVGESWTGGSLRRNSIFGNTGLGIDLDPGGPNANDSGDGDTGANNGQNYPVLTSASASGSTVSIAGSLNSTPNTSFDLEFFETASCDSNGFGEGRRYLQRTGGDSDTVTTDGSGDAAFTIDLTPQDAGSIVSGDVVTATATGPGGNTSEFSACRSVTGGGGGGGTFVVTKAADTNDGTCDSDCSLREAIVAANGHPNGDGPDIITFAIPGSGSQQIAVLGSPLPAISQPVVIDGDTERTTGTGIGATVKAIVINGDGAGANANGLVLGTGSGGSTIKGLAIRNFQCGAPCSSFGYGVVLRSDGNTVTQNYIGLSAAGDVAGPNHGGGVLVTGNGNIVGDNASPPGHADLTKGNVISGNNGPGITLSSAGSSKIAGNLIGTNSAGADLGNTDGIAVLSGGANTLGPENRIVHNGGNGISMGSANNRVVANSIHDNGLLGIDNDPAAVPFTVAVTTALSSGTSTTVSGTVSGAAPGVSFFIEYFDNTACDTSGFGEGETYRDFTTSTAADGSGHATFSFTTSLLAVSDIVTVTATNVAASPSTSEFSNCKTVTSGTAPPPGQQQFDVGGSDDHAQDDVLDLFLDCGPGKGKFPIALALSPTSASSTTASWTYNYDASLACEGGQLQAVINDGFRQSGFSSTGTEPVESAQKPPFSAILSPGKGATFLQYSGIPLKGLAFDAEDGALTPQWRLIRQSDNSVVRTAGGTTADLSPSASGWTAGEYTVELTATDSGGKTTTSTVGITIVPDADNDGLAASVDGGCLGGSDTDPLNAYSDKDGDGIPNADDPDPCTAQEGAYNAVMTFQPNPFPIPSSGNTVNVTVQVPYRNLVQVQSTSVAITAINGVPVTFRNVSWKVTNNIGQALFDRQALITYFSSHNIHKQTVVFTITGSSAAPSWSFKGVASTVVSG
jgi:CSLREA domain-containing protein